MGIHGPLQVISYSEICIDSSALGLNQSASSLHSSGRGVEHYDAVIVRTMPLGSLEQVIFRMNALHVAQRRGTRLINRPRTLEIAIDKWLTLDLASQSGLAIPRTHACQTRDQALTAFDALGRDVVVKPIFGGEGRGMIRVDDIDIAHRVFSTLEQIQAVAYLQEFVPHHGYDIRVLFIGDDFYCVARHAAGNDWRTNLSRGGCAIEYAITEKQLNMAKLAKDAIQGDVVGVDILPTLDGRDLLLEVNAVPGWKGVAKACDVDIAKKILELAVTEASIRSSPH